MERQGKKRGWELFCAILVTGILSIHSLTAADPAPSQLPLGTALPAQHAPDSTVWVLLVVSAGTLLILRRRSF